ncbi:MAG: HNH endonuclease, partial [Rhodospirillaceae bacterium]|nr:HNH endonuclease [Rhodospirillaceae bacterium]
RKARRKALERARRRCERCGATGRLEAHHRVPLAEGGAPRDPDNLEVLCPACHKAAH